MSVFRPALLQRITLSIGLSLSIASVLFAGDREVICFPDCSTSMQGQPIEAVKESLRLFAAIAENDVELRVVAFNHDIRDSGSLSLGTPAGRSSHQAFVNSIVAHGGTEYLPALMAHEWPPGSVGVFLSDGAPQGSASDVLMSVKSRLKGRMKLHCIGVNCDNSEARDLLMEMAAATDGSFADARTSEDIVQRFVELGVRNGNYRSHRPAESTLELKRAIGRVLVFAYDAEIDVQSSRPVRISHHAARLPGEVVSMASVECVEANDLSISIRNPKSATSRLGDVFVADLPVQTFDVDSVNGVVGTNTQLNATFGFKDAQGQAIPAGDQASATVELLDADGQIIETVAAKPVFNGQLDATVPVPPQEGAVTLRGVSNWMRDGLSFSQTTEKTVLARHLPEIEVWPSEINGRYKRGQEIRFTFKVQRKGSGDRIDPNLVEIDSDAQGVEVHSLTPASDGLEVELKSNQIGTISGKLKVTATVEGLPVAAFVEMDLLIDSNEKGLKQPPHQKVTLPDTFSGSQGTSEFLFQTDDKAELSYQLELTDAGSDAAALPMRLDSQVVQTSSDRTGRAVVSWDATGVPPGNYKATLTSSTTSLPNSRWVTDLLITVKSALAAETIDLGIVSVGQIADSKFTIVNHSDSPIAGVKLAQTKSVTEAPDDVHLKLNEQEFVIPANGQRSLSLQLLVSPLATQFGKHETGVDLIQGNRTLLQIPVKLAIDDRIATPAFQITPEPVLLQGKPGEVLEFQLLVRAQSSLQAPTQLAGHVGGFHDSQDQACRITASVIPDGTDKLRSTGSVKFKGIVICPRASGNYVGQIEIKANSGETSAAAIKLLVK